MLPDVATADLLPGPYELMEWSDGKRLIIAPVKWAIGKMFIKTGREPAGKWVIGMRLWVRPGVRPTLPDYWDFTSGHLVAGLYGYLQGTGGRIPTFTITWQGTGPQGRPSLGVTWAT